MMNPIPYGKQTITDEDINAVVDVLRSDFLTQGPKTGEFEEKFAAYIGSKYAVAVANGTAALHLSALALDVKPGDKYITTPITFAASANCIRYCGGDIHFVDIDPDTYTLDLQKTADLLERSPKGTFSGIIPVDYAGYPVNLEEFSKLAKAYDLRILEDACHAPGAYFVDAQGKKQKCGNGNFSDLAIFSFHPVKHIATGEGGMITTNDLSMVERLRCLRTHGITKDPDLMGENHGGWYYEMIELGYNYRLSDIHAALGISQLKRAEEGLRKRQKIAERYNAAFINSNVRVPVLAGDVSHAYHLYVIQVDDRKGLYDHLRKHQVFAQVHYIPVHHQPYYKKSGFGSDGLKNAEAFYETALSLPMYPSLSEDEQQYVIDKVLEFVR